MKCDFCQRDENDVKTVFSSVFSAYENKMRELGMQIDAIQETYAAEHGFINENFEKAKNIRRPFLNMKINSILNELDNFIEEEPNIQLLTDYYKEYKPEISNEKQIFDLLNLYIKEPTQDRLNYAVKEIFNEKNSIQGIYNKIKGKYDMFSDVEVEYAIPLNVFNYDNNIVLHILEEMSESSGTENNQTSSIRMHLCPYCTYLFNQFSIEMKNIRSKQNEASHLSTANNIVRVQGNSLYDPLQDWAPRTKKKN